MKVFNKLSIFGSSKIVILCLIVIGLQLHTVAQEEKFVEEEKKEKDFVIFSVLNEFTVSLNRTTVSDYNTEDRFGFGLGVFRAFFNQKRCNLVVGVEYNRSSQFKKFVKVWRENGYNDVTYNLDNLGIPIYFRVNMGKKVKFFLECGGFGEFIFSSAKEGSERLSGTIENICLVNYGISGGLGLRIPIDRYEILIKGDYKWGIRNTMGDRNDLYNRYWRFTMGFKINPRNSVVLY